MVNSCGTGLTSESGHDRRRVRRVTPSEASPRTIDSNSVKARLAELHLRDYLEYVVWPILEPSTPFIGGWPIDAMCEHLEAVTDEDTNDGADTSPGLRPVSCQPNVA